MFWAITLKWFWRCAKFKLVNHYHQLSVYLKLLLFYYGERFLNKTCEYSERLFQTGPLKLLNYHSASDILMLQILLSAQWLGQPTVLDMPKSTCTHTVVYCWLTMPAIHMWKGWWHHRSMCGDDDDDSEMEELCSVSCACVCMCICLLSSFDSVDVRRKKEIMSNYC